MIKNILIIFVLYILLLSGCAHYYIVHIDNFFKNSIYLKMVTDLDDLYRSHGFKKRGYPYKEEIWGSNTISIVHNRIGEKLKIIVVALPGENEEEAQVMALYIKQYLYKGYPELNIEVKKETTIDLR